ncbi:hypothetical protein LZ31DRAFT_246942 [Colletotrichum somersetense]|nr:hypothetical protein LZ31DRAFT_246942 [Colletotrichum somersetense]
MRSWKDGAPACVFFFRHLLLFCFSGIPPSTTTSPHMHIGELGSRMLCLFPFFFFFFFFLTFILRRLNDQGGWREEEAVGFSGWACSSYTIPNLYYSTKLLHPVLGSGGRKGRRGFVISRRKIYHWKQKMSFFFFFLLFSPPFSCLSLSRFSCLHPRGGFFSCLFFFLPHILRIFFFSFSLFLSQPFYPASGSSGRKQTQGKRRHARRCKGEGKTEGGLYNFLSLFLSVLSPSLLAVYMNVATIYTIE